MKAKKNALKLEWIWFCLSSGKELTDSVGNFCLGVNVPQSVFTEFHFVCVDFLPALPSPAFKPTWGMTFYCPFGFKVHLQHENVCCCFKVSEVPCL